jgi:hypothetical protein
MDLITEIRAKCSPVLIAGQNTQAIADAVSVGRVRIASKLIGIGTILATLGASGGIFLDGLVAMGAHDRNVFWAMELIKSGQLDIGMQATRDQVAALGQAMPEMAPAVAALLALAEVPDPITELDVRCALWDAAGNWLGD